MKSTTAFGFLGLIAACLLAFAWFEHRCYGVIDGIQGVSVLNSKDEIFVFVGHSKAVLRETRFLSLAKHLTSTLSFPETVSDDLLVARFKNGNISKFDLIGFGHSGSPFVYGHQLYWGRGQTAGDTGPMKWKWNGSGFAILPGREALLLDYKHIKDIDDATRAEGWDMHSFNAGSRNAEVRVHLLNQEIRIYSRNYSDSNGQNQRTQVVMSETGTTPLAESLIDLVDGYCEFDKREYLKLKAQKVGGHDSKIETRTN